MVDRELIDERASNGSTAQASADGEGRDFGSAVKCRHADDNSAARQKLRKKMRSREKAVYQR